MKNLMTIKILGIRSIPLGKETRNAWRHGGVKFIRRSRNLDRIIDIVDRNDYSAILNLGNRHISANAFNVAVFNDWHSVRAISTPLALRRTLNDYIPPFPSKGDDYWVKGRGFGGVNKYFHTDWPGIKQQYVIDDNSDRQCHIQGIEYRILTVGDVIVQASRKEKHNEFDPNGFTWYWVGLDGIRNNGIIPHVKSAITLVPNWEYTVFGWDIIVGNDSNNGLVYIIEINTSPGVNNYSAQRVVEQIKRMI